MLRSLKSILGAGLLVLTALSAQAFALLGPVNESFQTPTLGYQNGDDLGAPKNLGEEYRWNVPVLYYSVDQNFLDYFGSNGLAQVQAALDAFNAIPPASALATNLSSFPTESMRHNFRAEALHLVDLKSQVMEMITREVGLSQPDRWTWCLRAQTATGPCPSFDYTVIHRNFDPFTQNYSSYVNGTLYTYFITQSCSPLQADAVENPVDPLARQNTAVANWSTGVGDYYTGWTRDDVGGLLYLLSPTAVPNNEPAVPGVQLIQTNSTPQLLVTSNLVDLANNSLTNDAPALQAIYPGLIITGTTNVFTNLFATNITSYFTNLPTAPVGTTNTQVFVTNLTPFVATVFYHSFANVVTNHFYTNTLVTLQSILLTNYPTEPVGTPQHTNTVSISSYVNQPSGDFYILPQTDTNCGLAVISTQLTNVVVTTNVAFVQTNAPPGTNKVNQLLTQLQLVTSTNYSLVVNQVLCPQGPNALRRGIDKVTFVRRDFDSLLGQFFIPVTNTFTTHEVANNADVQRSYRRVVQTPDIKFSTADLDTGTSSGNLFQIDTPRFIQSTNYPGLAGPGILQPGLTFLLLKVGPTLLNQFNGDPTSLTEAGATTQQLWGSYDGTTNDPVVYPSTVSIQALNDMLVLRVTNPAAPAAKVGAAFSYTLQGAGGQSPYTWAFVPNQFGMPGGMPPGLSILPNGVIIGTPTTAGTYNFVVQMSDAASRFIQQPLTITVNP
jgi:hypothetical protein